MPLAVHAPVTAPSSNNEYDDPIIDAWIANVTEEELEALIAAAKQPTSS